MYMLDIDLSKLYLCCFGLYLVLERRACLACSILNADVDSFNCPHKLGSKKRLKAKAKNSHREREKGMLTLGFVSAFSIYN